MPKIRMEYPGDELSVRKVNEKAFERSDEADIIDRLRENCSNFLSFVAIVDGQIVGHILFTPAWIESPGDPINGMGLAPLAVLPAYQNRGIGGQLIQFGMDQIQKHGYPFVIVLGHPGYYPRFGFEKASRFDIHCEYEGVPDEAFMIHIFDPDVLPRGRTIAHYRPEWAEAT